MFSLLAENSWSDKNKNDASAKILNLELGTKETSSQMFEEGMRGTEEAGEDTGRP